jgi:hypothetical protein
MDGISAVQVLILIPSRLNYSSNDVQIGTEVERDLIKISVATHINQSTSALGHISLNEWLSHTPPIYTIPENVYL